MFFSQLAVLRQHGRSQHADMTLLRYEDSEVDDDEEGEEEVEEEDVECEDEEEVEEVEGKTSPQSTM